VDGFFMAMRPRRILDAGACFDTRFRFHHYDIDFCWNARSRGLRVGTWPIWVVHSGSSGNFPADPTYAVSRQAYMEKYGA
jgi:GT2 family glycosyltransferase